MSEALLTQLEDDTAEEVSQILPLDLLLYILLSLHNNKMTGMTCGSYSVEAASDCRCLEEGNESPKLTSVGEEGQVPLLSEDSEKLLDSPDDGSFEGDLDENLLLDSHDGSRMEDSLPLELASLTVSLPLDVTNGKFEEVLQAVPGGVGGNNPTQPGPSSALYKPIQEVAPLVLVVPENQVAVHDVSSSEEDDAMDLRDPAGIAVHREL